MHNVLKNNINAWLTVTLRNGYEMHGRCKEVGGLSVLAVPSDPFTGVVAVLENKDGRQHFLVSEVASVTVAKEGV